MPTPAISDETLLETIEAYKANNYSVSGTAKAMGLSRQGIQWRLRAAHDRGMMPTEIKLHEANLKTIGPVGDIIARQKAAFELRKRRGHWRTPHKIELAYEGPFMIIAYGDPHLDDDGTDLELFEKWLKPLDAANRVYAVHLGDFLNNWLRVLGFLWGEQTTTPPEAWELFKHYLHMFGPHTLAAILGNHDEWQSGGYLFSELFDRYNCYVAPAALRLEITQPNLKEPLTIGCRHRWNGHSQWNPAHAIMKHAQMGMRDDLLLGGDYHISGDGIVTCPDTGRVTHCHQLASFKIFDRYADEKGLMDKHVAPAEAFVFKPWLPSNDPNRVTRFHDPEQARVVLEYEREKFERGA